MQHDRLQHDPARETSAVQGGDGEDQSVEQHRRHAHNTPCTQPLAQDQLQTGHRLGQQRKYGAATLFLGEQAAADRDGQYPRENPAHHESDIGHVHRHSAQAKQVHAHEGDQQDRQQNQKHIEVLAPDDIQPHDAGHGQDAGHDEASASAMTFIKTFSRRSPGFTSDSAGPSAAMRP